MLYVIAIKQQGKLVFTDKRLVQDFVNKLKEGTKVAITLKRWKPNRTLQQNRLYWMWLGIISEHTGHTDSELDKTFATQFFTPEQIHDAFKRGFLNERVGFIGNTIRLEVYPSTKVLSVNEFSEYMDKVFQFATTEMKITLPTIESYFFE